LQHIAFAIAAFGQTQIVQCADARKAIRCEDQRVNQLRRVDGVFAVIAGVMVSSGDIDFIFIYERIQA
jgi:hypothetical protein